MLKRLIFASALSLFMAVSAGLCAVPAVSAPVSFGFAVPLLADGCPRTFVCGGVGRIWVTLELDDLRTESMRVGPDHLVAGAVLFPTLGEDGDVISASSRFAAPVVPTLRDLSFSGVYSYDAVTGTAELSLLAYAASPGDINSYHPLGSWYEVWWTSIEYYPGENRWVHGCADECARHGGGVSSVSWSSPASRLSAVALVGPAVVPIPAAVYLFMSALAGLVGVKRFARKS